MNIRLDFIDPGYIESPYWPELYKTIEISKKSGMNRVRSEKAAKDALSGYLSSQKMKMEDYEALVALAQRPFHTKEDGEIFIPGDKILSCLVSACDEAPSKMRIPSLRTTLRASDFLTGKTIADAFLWERFAVVKTGAGKTLSNQRSFRSNHVIKGFSASGHIEHDKDEVSVEAVIQLFKFAGHRKGIGSSRKMGYGRFTVKA